MITLWTYQSARVWALLHLHHWHTASWKTTGGAGWAAAYRWMVAVMEKKGIPVHSRPPVWAWHSCGIRGGKPTEVVGRSLLSDQQLENGIVLMEIRVPRELVLLSWYGAWNQVLDWFVDGAQGTLPVTETDLFVDPAAITPRTFPWHETGIQACLPYLFIDWVRNVELVPKPNTAHLST